MRFNNHVSRSFNVPSGVPQESYLGPLLFILFINDIGKSFKFSNFLHYADDLKIFRQINDSYDSLLLQSDLSSLEVWCNRNRLYLNLFKCHAIYFTHNRNCIMYDYSICGSTLSIVSTIRDLGVSFCNDLSFNAHIKSMVASASVIFGFLYSWGKFFNNINTLKILCVSSP